MAEDVIAMAKVCLKAGRNHSKDRSMPEKPEDVTARAEVYLQSRKESQ